MGVDRQQVNQLFCSAQVFLIKIKKYCRNSVEGPLRFECNFHIRIHEMKILFAESGADSKSKSKVSFGEKPMERIKNDLLDDTSSSAHESTPRLNGKGKAAKSEKAAKEDSDEVRLSYLFIKLKFLSTLINKTS